MILCTSFCDGPIVYIMYRQRACTVYKSDELEKIVRSSWRNIIRISPWMCESQANQCVHTVQLYSCTYGVASCTMFHVRDLTIPTAVHRTWNCFYLKILNCMRSACFSIHCATSVKCADAFESIHNVRPDIHHEQWKCCDVSLRQSFNKPLVELLQQFALVPRGSK